MNKIEVCWRGRKVIADCSAGDVLIIGTGLAGLYTALNLEARLNVIMISKIAPENSCSMHAQGGIAAALAENDNPERHYQDSWEAGSRLGDPENLKILVKEGPNDIKRLIEWGVSFDSDHEGNIALGMEGAHSRKRIVHCQGDATGLHVTETLLRRLLDSRGPVIAEDWCLAELLRDQNGRIAGVLALSAVKPQKFHVFQASAVVLASGGLGNIYSRTTNAKSICGDGQAAALRQGAVLQDMEFIQFHPTGFYQEGQNGQCFLISEALRGEGAILRSLHGEPFMETAHPMADLAARDITARAIIRQMQASESMHVWLDATEIAVERLKTRFPVIYETCLDVGYDLARQWLPVAPVQHYAMGGIKTDSDGHTNLPGLYACGEVACTGVHGANRLASNSLLECLVFGRRTARAVQEELAGGKESREKVILTPPVVNGENSGFDLMTAQNREKYRRQINHLLDSYAGIIRTVAGLKKAERELEELHMAINHNLIQHYKDQELLNIAECGRAVIKAALARKDSTGAHYLVE